MSAAVTNEDLFRRAYANTHKAADDLAALSVKIDGGACVTGAELLAQLTAVRNDLRAALGAVQELKTRAKKLNRKMVESLNRNKT